MLAHNLRINLCLHRHTFPNLNHNLGPRPVPAAAHFFIQPLPKIDLTDAERAALASLAQEYVRTQRYPLAPRLEPIKSALLKLAPADELPESPKGPRKKSRR
jgi:hypothetical protein